MTKRPEIFLISMAAELLEMHPQTLRKYERLGLVQPSRTLGSMRVYTQDELDRLRLIKTLVDREGINLAGVHRLLSVLDVVQRLRPMVRETSRRHETTDLQRQLDDQFTDLFRLLGLDEPGD
jgi:MerR family transcriptional regulator/heat shock protein HspR